MKSKTVLRVRFSMLAAGAALAFVTSQAQAESSVTLYGVVDAGLGYVSNAATATSAGKAGKPAVLTGHDAYGLYSGTWTGSRWGLLGEEDLGQGLSAIFRLENGFSVANGTLGQGSRMFGRHAYVGLKDKTYGTLTLGRQYDPLIDLVGSVGGTAIMSGVAATPGDVDNLDHSSRVNNAIKYRSPTFGGWTGEALYALGGVAGSFTQQGSLGLGVQYKGGPLTWGIAYANARNDGSTVGAWTGSSDSAFGSSINAGYASAKSRSIIATSATYRIGATTLGAQYSHTEYTPGSFSQFAKTIKFDSGAVLAMYQWTPTLRTGISYGYTHANAPAANASPATYHQGNLAAFYTLSKRTELYALVGYQRASGNTLDAYGNVIAATASVGDAGNGLSSSSRSQTLMRLGMSHSF